MSGDLPSACFNTNSMNKESILFSIKEHFTEGGQYVPRKPNFSIRFIISRNAGGKGFPFPLSQNRTVFTFSGSGALFQAARILKLSDRDNILCPAYNCGHEIEPFLQNKVQVKLYSVKEDLQVDIDHLLNQIDLNTRAVLVTHYFGFPQNTDYIRSICDEHNLFLIEDCAHVLYSKDVDSYLGTIGDLAIFSMRKSLPVPNGGALVINNDKLSFPENLEDAPIFGTWNKMLDLFIQSVKNDGLDSGRKLKKQFLLLIALPLIAVRKLFYKLTKHNFNLWYDPDSDTYQVDPKVYSWRMGKSSVKIFNNTDHEAVFGQRRQNFEYLQSALSDVKLLRPIFNSLPEGVCPLFFPVICDKPQILMGKLSENGIGAICWWQSFNTGISFDGYEIESFLKRQTLALPIHQDLKFRHLEKMVKAIKESI